MSVQILEIEQRIRQNPVQVAGLHDFVCSPGLTIAAEILLINPQITPPSWLNLCQ
jgi:hypothetical protein